MSTTTAKGVPKPELTDAPNGPHDIGAVADWVDARPGIATLTYAQIGALSGADLWTGRSVWQSDTGTNRPIAGIYEYGGAAWRQPWGTAWGILDQAVRSSLSQSVNTSADDVVGLSVSKTVPANRHLEVRASVPLVVQNTSSGIAKVSITDSANVVKGMVIDQLLAADPAVASRAGGERGIPVEGASGALSFKVRAVTSAATLTITGNADDPGPAWIRLIDLGPAGAPA